MTYRTQPDEHLRRARENLSVAAQLLHSVADHISGYEPEEPVNNQVLGLAFTYAGYTVLAQYPSAVQDHALERALRFLPGTDTDGPELTSGEYAVRLRAAAGRAA